MAPSSNNTAHTSHDEENRRGETIVKDVLRIRVKGPKLKIGWSKKGKPIKPNKQKFVRYIGTTARENVPIIYNDWVDVPEQIKDNVWSNVESAFLVDDRHRKYVLEEADRLWSQFRSNLAKCVTDDDGNVNEHPPQTYSRIIPDDDWKKFVAQHVHEPSKTLSDENLQRLLEPAYQYTRSCMRNASLEQNTVEEEGSYVTSLPRHVLWRAGHVNKQGLIDNPNVQQVLEKCEKLSQSISQKETQECGRQDIVDGALNILDHPGRVTGVGFGVSQRDYTSEKRSKRGNFGKAERLEVLVETPQQQVNTLLQMQMQEQELEKQPNLPPTNGRDSSLPLPLAANIPKGPTQCLLCLAVPDFRMVGIGTVYNLSGDRLHNRPLPLNHVRVSVDAIIEGSAPLPVPDEDAELFTVENALGTCVAWPINLIQFDIVTPTQSQSEGKTIRHPKVVVAESQKKQTVLQPCVGDGATKLPFYCELLHVYGQSVLTNGTQLRIPIEEAIFNYDCVEHIGLDEVNQVVHHEQLGASVVSVYIRFLYEQMLVPDNLRGKFSFLLPHRTSLYAEQQTHYIIDALKAQAQPDKLFLAPYNVGEHWVLIVINAFEGRIYYLDPLNGDPRHRKEMKTLFDTAWKIYRVTTRAAVPAGKQNNITWDNIKCPRQTNNIDCGYYILKFMKDIITHNEPMIPLEYFQDCRCSFYSNDQLDEVKEEWASYVLDNFC